MPVTGRCGMPSLTGCRQQQLGAFFLSGDNDDDIRDVRRRRTEWRTSNLCQCRQWHASMVALCCCAPLFPPPSTTSTTPFYGILFLCCVCCCVAEKYRYTMSFTFSSFKDCQPTVAATAAAAPVRNTFQTQLDADHTCVVPV